MTRLFLLGACAVCLFALVSVAGAALIGPEHVDDNDPTGEGWTFSPFGSHTVVADPGPPLNWKITCGSHGKADYTVNLTRADFTDVSGNPIAWTSTMLAKYINGDRRAMWGGNVFTGEWCAGWTWDDDVGDGTPDIFVCGTNPPGYEDIPLGGAIDPIADYHYYQIIYDPAGEGTVTWYMDGTSVYSAPESEMKPKTTAWHYFGDGDSSTGISSGAHFALVRLETGIHIYNPGEPIPGDANGDNVVDDKDASILAAHWQQSGGWGDGDFNNDGVVNDQDASILAAHWLEREGAAPVPEPSVLVLLAGGLLWLLVRRARL